MGKITEALKKATKEKIERLDRHSSSGAHSFIAKKIVDSKIDPHVVTFHETDSVVAEQYRILRTNLQSIQRDEKPVKTIVISSSVAGEGKTVTAVNLAISLAQDIDKKSVLLIDADLRKGKVRKYLGLERKNGLAELLNNGTALDDVLLDVGIENLTVLPSGSFPKNPAELLASNKAKKVLSKLKEQFDYIVIDTPPIVSITDPRVLGHHADGVVLVVQAGRTQKGVIEHTRELLRQSHAKVLGFVLTNVKYHLPEYLYRYIQSGHYGKYQQ